MLRVDNRGITSEICTEQNLWEDESPPLQWSEVSLVGREEEAGVIRRVIDACGVYMASPQAILLQGESGTGKTALATMLLTETALVGCGKFDQGINNPYTAVVTAISAVLYDLMSERDIESDLLKSKLRSSFTSDEMLVLIKVIPILKQLTVGEPFASTSYHSESSVLQFRSLFRRLLSLLGSSLKPVILMIDDLQWADEASRELLDAVLKDASIPNFVFVGLLRTSEERTFKPPIGDDVMKITTLKLDNWNVEQINELLVLVLAGCEMESTKELAELLHQRTYGNPFFVKQYLDIMVDSRLLRFDPANDRHIWDTEQVKKALSPTETALGLTVKKMRSLSHAALFSIATASCLGHSFDAGTLESLVVSTDLLSVFKSHGGLISMADLLSIDALALKEALEGATSLGLIEVKVVNDKQMYSFTHDRIQQAARSLIAKDKLQEILATIGSLLLELGEANKNDTWWTTAGVRLLLENPTEEATVNALKLAQLGLKVAKLSANQTAFADAAWFTDRAIELLGDDSWNESTYDLCLELHNLSAETHRSAVHMKMTKTRVEAVQKHGREAKHKFRAYNVFIDSLQTQKKYKEIIDEVNQELYVLGFGPRKPGLFDALRTIFQVSRLLKGRRATDLSSITAYAYKDNDEVTQAMNMLFSTAIAAWSLSDVTTSIASAFKPFLLTLKFGVGPLSAFAFACHASILSFQGKLEDAYAYGELTLATMERNDIVTERECMARGTAWVTAMHLKRPMHEVILVLKDAVAIGERNGEHSDAYLMAYHTIACCSFGALPCLMLQR